MPTSPVWSQPSESIAAAVASGHGSTGHDVKAPNQYLSLVTGRHVFPVVINHAQFKPVQRVANGRSDGFDRIRLFADVAVPWVSVNP